MRKGLAAEPAEKVERRAARVSPHLERLVALLSGVSDPRSARGCRYHVLTILVVALLAMVAGCNDCEAIAQWGASRRKWLSKFLPVGDRMPAHEVYLDTLNRLDTDEVSRILTLWVREVGEALGVAGEKLLSLDGKAVRACFDRVLRKCSVHVVSLWCEEFGLVFGQIQTDAKTNELKSGQELLKAVDLKGTIVTADAMHCDRATTEIIDAKQASYCIVLGANQPNLHAAVAATFANGLDPARRPRDQFRAKISARAKDTDKGHGRIDTRRAWVTADLRMIPPEILAKWPSVKAFGLVVRSRFDVAKGTESNEAALFILNDPKTTSAQVLAMTRGHWGVENGLHRTLDVTFKEDEHRVRRANAAANLTVIRKLALMFLKNPAINDKKSIALRRLRAAMEEDYVLELLSLRPLG